MTTALSLGCISFIRTAHNPTVRWHSASHRHGVHPFESVEYAPFVARFKNTPPTIFENNNAIIVRAVSPEDGAVDVREENMRVVQRTVEEALTSAAVVVRAEADDEEGGAEAESGLAQRMHRPYSSVVSRRSSVSNSGLVMDM
eukprot:GFKZ01012684.1.p1 GENE.GFKZ01012684.1~~GFKZ01012684.1.p1  ORF type:complete len:143 (-),score=25.84 GFKZ01012684.1:180-608(-)